MEFYTKKLIRTQKDVLDVNSFINSIYDNIRNIKVYRCKNCWYYFLHFDYNNNIYCYIYNKHTIKEKALSINHLLYFTWVNPLRYILCKKCKSKEL